MTDLVYVLGAGSLWDDNELRFSLRSLHAHVRGTGRLYVVGRAPRWLTNATVLQYPDKHACKERNIMEKMAYACGHPDLTPTFLSVHDDHLALAPTAVLDIPNWRGRTLAQLATGINPRNHWRDAVLTTDLVLTVRGLTNWNFDVHFPMLMEKALFPKVMDEYDWKGTHRGFVVKSLYANTVGLTGPMIQDVKLTSNFTLEETVRRIKGKPWFSLGSHRPDIRMRELLAALYPVSSPWELP